LLPGQVWHITHRCHQREFLLKFGRDRQRWRYWLFEARKRFGLSVLNYVVTSNHVHLLVVGRGQGEIARGMQLIAGGTAQEYNQRTHAAWMDEALKAEPCRRDESWTRSLAVGSQAFVARFQSESGIATFHREMVQGDGCCYATLGRATTAISTPKWPV
jgi:REP element-mobilizing transposase RayT